MTGQERSQRDAVAVNGSDGLQLRPGGPQGNRQGDTGPQAQAPVARRSGDDGEPAQRWHVRHAPQFIPAAPRGVREAAPFLGMTPIARGSH